jgi:hypothetical protein
MLQTLTTARKALAFALCLVLTAVPSEAQQAERVRIVVLEGEGAIHNIRGSKAIQLRVQLQTDNGRPVPRTPVTFVVPSTGPGGRFADGTSALTILTNKEGQALARGFQPNGTVGQFPVRVSATYRGETARATVMQTNAAPVDRNPRKTILWVSLIGAAVLGAAIAVSAITNAGSPAAPDAVRDTPFSPNR